ncbi:delta-1-pyrroline-5-carboxylate dehydrogenase, mitochondrial [Amyelois transitella]|uniref:delta-1-pyrroline-5-carboxylate dehydrogenase, mitochondrial n=1 Tax=Amyelois transitella TaxID=680683 RepID=UPI00067B10E3|nr:delta-1-pyrroline-5-carboxylate dehydrogenase, mitochondrial [Amyelois transitella]
MLSICFRTVRKPRLLERAYSSVVELPRLPDFGVRNEPILEYRAGSVERCALACELQRAMCMTEEVPIVIGDECIRDGEPRYQVMPHCHGRRIAKYYYASEKTIQKAIDTAVKAQVVWDRTPFEVRIEIFSRAAEMMACQYRQSLNAATMMGQSKSVIQAEIDAACELIDFFRFNVYFLKENLKYQPISENPHVTRNSLRFRGLDGFIAAIAPFNFTAIGGNLAYTPALMGNAVLWKPSDTAVLSNWRIFNILREAGMPPGVVNFLPADGPVFGKTITSSPYLSGINFTGSVPTFNWLWNAVGKNLSVYHNYPRLIGECGGKNYHFVHPTADVKSVVAGTIRSAFEYCGQKCSACSRMYIPKSLADSIKHGLIVEASKLKIGDVTCDFSTFTGAVIDDKAFARITGYIVNAKKNPKNTILVGGQFDCSQGYYVMPTIIETTDPHDKLMTEEIFGPVLTIYVYDDAQVHKALQLVGSSTKFALTGAVFAQDMNFLKLALDELKMTAGNFYLNDKSTGSVVGQQPFGGGRMSGTNDKAGGPNYVMRWTTPQSIKETFVPITDINYKYMSE